MDTYLEYADSLSKSEDLSWEQIAKQVFDKFKDEPKCSSNALRKRVSRFRGRGAGVSPVPSLSIDGSFPRWPEYNKGVEYCDRIEKDWQKVVVVGDLHFPTMNVKEYQKMVINNSDADGLVVNGDGPDVDKLSYFGAERAWVGLKEELLGWREVLRWTQEYIPEIIWLSGNHEFRAKRMWHYSLPDELRIIARPPDISDFVNTPGVYLEEEEEYKPIEVEYIDHFQVILNDILLTHPSQVRKSPLSVAIERMLSMWKGGYEVKGLIYNHTHFADGVKIVNGDFVPLKGRDRTIDIKELKSLLTQVEKLLAIREDVIVIENGCMCYLQQYARDSRTYIYRPYDLGYTVLHFDENKCVDIEKSSFVSL